MANAERGLAAIGSRSKTSAARGNGRGAASGWAASPECRASWYSENWLLSVEADGACCSCPSVGERGNAARAASKSVFQALAGGGFGFQDLLITGSHLASPSCTMHTKDRYMVFTRNGSASIPNGRPSLDLQMSTNNVTRQNYELNNQMLKRWPGGPECLRTVGAQRNCHRDNFSVVGHEHTGS